ncbi:helix-turn-helix domain-containing protein [Actinomadura sp. HBU206391]|uniref:helix-turn-helix domain-containing protein n=1 Tax=Actinomadura sp. HBU206391 TaxID=2731692 RepID=UPI00164FE3D3|nr:helix-turn-helix transcriptional regulator [Actinomadura sp. HBU206391]MBC6456603.1 helix-turn-helix domain-containing protein [Actinomadura sp. HBU206391]
MEHSRRSPTVRRRRLGIELRKLREAAGMSALDVTRALEWSPGKVTRLEKAQAVKPMVVDTRLLLDLYGVPKEDPRYEELVTLTREARQRGWWISYKDVLDDPYAEFEAGAEKIQTYELANIPGLLQTPAYAAALYRGWLIRDPAEIERLVQLRMQRQAILSHDSPPYIWAVIDETALLRPFGTVEERREQLRRLIDTERFDHITIQVLPLDVGPHLGMAGPFSILDFPENDPSLVYVETEPNSLYLEERTDIQRYSVVFQNLSAMALSPDASIAHLTQLAHHWSRGRT